jgi:hypothetical protein
MMVTMQILKDQFTNKEKLKKDLICYKHLSAEFIWPYKLKPFTSTDTFDRVFRLTGCVTPSSQDIAYTKQADTSMFFFQLVLRCPCINIAPQ